MMKYFSLICILLLSCSPKEKPEVWVDLFNGKDINDWTVKIHHHEVGKNFGSTFRVVDDMIQVRYDQYGDFNDQFAHLYYNKPFSKFHWDLCIRHL